MEIYKVTEKDLIDDIKGFPIEVVQKMVERQYEQIGYCDVTVFKRNSASCKGNNGFEWENTKEGYYFWFYVIQAKLFNHFFDRYPKQIQEQEEDCWIKLEGVRMLVWDDNESKAVERIVIAKLPKNTALPYIAVNQHYDRQFEKGEEYYTASYKYAKPIPQIKEITVQEIADKFGISVDKLKIKK